ncbi:MAG TPA: hypothetical protein VMD04_02760 [Candidatus Margulisiibacteriota bacterium]|nr:hypothetical protein [Candidatus Margulisiibacteriota bacterium]
MDKKDIYEHLAKIYLDASSQKKKKSKKKPIVSKGLFFTGSFVVLSLVAVITSSLLLKPKSFIPETALVIADDALKINFSFTPVKKEVVFLNLNKLNLADYKALGFSVKKADFNDTLSLRVEFNNIFNEKSEVYCKNISYKWQKFKINLSDFKKISDWSEMSGLSFTVEEWNSRDKKGLVYIDNVRLIK